MNPAWCRVSATASARVTASLPRPMNSSSTRYRVRLMCGYRSNTAPMSFSSHGRASGAAPAHCPLWPRGQNEQ